MSPIHGADAITLLTRLSRESWSLTGQEVVDYPRRAIPCRFVPWPPQ